MNVGPVFCSETNTGTNTKKIEDKNLLNRAVVDDTQQLLEQGDLRSLILEMMKKDPHWVLEKRKDFGPNVSDWDDESIALEALKLAYMVFKRYRES